MELHGQDIHMDEARMDASKLIILVKTFSPHLEELPSCTSFYFYFYLKILKIIYSNKKFWGL